MAPKSTAHGSTSKVIKTVTSKGTTPPKIVIVNRRRWLAGILERFEDAVEDPELTETIGSSPLAVVVPGGLVQVMMPHEIVALQNMSDIPQDIAVEKRADGKWEFTFDSRFVKDICFGIPSRNQYTNK